MREMVSVENRFNHDKIGLPPYFHVGQTGFMNFEVILYKSHSARVQFIPLNFGELTGIFLVYSCAMAGTEQEDGQ